MYLEKPEGQSPSVMRNGLNPRDVMSVISIALSSFMLLPIFDVPTVDVVSLIFLSIAIGFIGRADLSATVLSFSVLAGYGVDAAASHIGLPLRPVPMDVVGIVIPFAAASIVLRERIEHAGLIALVTAATLTLFQVFSLSFGVPAFQSVTALIEACVSALIVGGIVYTYRTKPLWNIAFSRTPLGRLTRWLTAGAVAVPWVSGVVLYRGFGVTERAVPIEAMVMLAIVITLLATILGVTRQLSISNALRDRDEDRLRRKAHTDELTGLLNRAGVRTELESRWITFKEENQQGAVILFDLDHFKSINDTFGHDAGDAVLRAIQGAVTPFMRSGDTVARWGGEEFVCVLAVADIEQLGIIAERLRSAIEGLTMPMSKRIGSPVLISASFGVACFAPEDSSYADAITRADKALYAAKKKGRNRVSFDTPMLRGQSAPKAPQNALIT